MDLSLRLVQLPDQISPAVLFFEQSEHVAEETTGSETEET